MDETNGLSNINRGIIHIPREPGLSASLTGNERHEIVQSSTLVFDLQNLFNRLIAKRPALQASDPHFKTTKGKRWLESYTSPTEAAKHLHNHKDYRFYEE